MIMVLLSVTVFVQGQECATSDCHGDMLETPVVHAALDDCTMCHQGDESHDFPAFPDPISELCFMCHEDVTAGDTVHMAVDMNGCLGCHNPHGGDHEKLLTDAMPGLCFMCHEDNMEGKQVHMALEMDGCTGCHSPHSGDHTALLTAAMPDLCFQCHDGELFSDEFVHGPVGAGDCATCHAAHSSANATLLTDVQPQLCTQCHMDQDFSDGSATSHTALEMDGCTGCHNPHASANTMQLIAPRSEMCGLCHTTADEAMEMNVPHAPVLEEGGCFSCHNPHGSAYSPILLKPVSQLCGNCHNGKTVDGLDIRTKLADSTDLHFPVAGGECAGCHGPHGADHAALLVMAYPDRFYAPFEEGAYELCFMCHDPVVFEEPESEDTGFRHGSRNLHYLHVNKEKGRTCRACHDVHGVNGEHLVRDTVRFGKWDLPVGFEPTEGGGTCNAGCHKPYSYQRNIEDSQ